MHLTPPLSLPRRLSALPVRTLLTIAIAVGATLTTGASDAHALDFGSSSSGRCTQTAAATLGWGTAARSDDFTSLNNWSVYEGTGHDGNGRRTAASVAISDGALTITSSANGDSGGVSANWGGRKYGRWEVCARTTVSSPNWHAVALLWPDAEDWPVGGEVDFMEISDAISTVVQYNLHYGAANNVESHSTITDAYTWHSWAVEWTPNHIAVFRDGTEWARTTDTSRLPPRSMHLALQLDNFGGLLIPTGQLLVDRVAEYGL